MVIYGCYIWCSSCDLCFLIRTNMCVMKWSENVMSFNIKHDCNCLDLDKVSLKRTSKNLVRSKLKPSFKIVCFILNKRICIWIAGSKKYKKCSLLAKQIFYLCLCSQKNRSARMLAKTICYPFNSLIISCFLNAVNPLTPRINVVWSKKKKTWGSKIQHWFWGELG